MSGASSFSFPSVSISDFGELPPTPYEFVVVVVVDVVVVAVVDVVVVVEIVGVVM